MLCAVVCNHPAWQVHAGHTLAGGLRVSELRGMRPLVADAEVPSLAL
jgi:hypothetical protein